MGKPRLSQDRMGFKARSPNSKFTASQTLSLCFVNSPLSPFLSVSRCFWDLVFLHNNITNCS